MNACAAEISSPISAAISASTRKFITVSSSAQATRRFLPGPSTPRSTQPAPPPKSTSSASPTPTMPAPPLKPSVPDQHRFSGHVPDSRCLSARGFCEKRVLEVGCLIRTNSFSGRVEILNWTSAMRTCYGMLDKGVAQNDGPFTAESSQFFPQLPQSQLQPRYHASNLFCFFFLERGLRNETQRGVIRLACVGPIPVNLFPRLRLQRNSRHGESGTQFRPQELNPGLACVGHS